MNKPNPEKWLYENNNLQKIDIALAWLEANIPIDNFEMWMKLYQYYLFSKPEKLFGAMKGSALICGDIVSPIDEPWSAESELFKLAGDLKNSPHFQEDPVKIQKRFRDEWE